MVIIAWASLVVQWLRIHLAMQGTPVQFLFQEDPICCRATKAMCPGLEQGVAHRGPKPTSLLNYRWNPCSTTPQAAPLQLPRKPSSDLGKKKRQRSSIDGGPPPQL